MSKFLGGDSVNHDDRRGLIGELNEELKQSLSSFEPVRNRIGSVTCIFNEHTPGYRAAQTIEELGRLGNPPLVFQEDAGLMGSSGVARSVDTSLGPLIDAKTGSLDVKGSCVGSLNYTEQVSEASSMRGSFVFSVDARNRLIKEAEGLSAVKLGGDFFDRSLRGRFTGDFLCSSSLDDIVSEEVGRLRDFSFIMELREKVALLQIISCTAGLLNGDMDTLQKLGINDHQASLLLGLFDGFSETKPLDIATVYGSAHRGFYHLVKGALPQARRQRVMDPEIYTNRSAYGVMHVFGGDEREVAALSVLEDMLELPLRESTFLNTLPKLGKAECNMFTSKMARALAREAGGARQALDSLNMEEVIKKMERDGIILRV